jgi:hypothetical protein
MKKSLFFMPVTAILIFCSFMMQTKPWDVPEEFKNMKNPVAKSDKVLMEGKTKYIRVCAGCHGLTGKGDGEKIKNLTNIKPVSLTTDNVGKETDGEHFF